MLVLILTFNYAQLSFARNHYPNYLNINAINLDHHLISADISKNQSLFILGSSGAAGSNVPPSSTLTDYLNYIQKDFTAFNLAKLEGASLESLIFLKLALEKKKPKVVLIGLSPDMFSEQHASLTAAINIDKLKNDLPLESYNLLTKEIRRKIYLKWWVQYTSQRYAPIDFLIELRTTLYNLKVQFFGQTFARDLTGQKGTNLDSFNRQKNPFVFLDSISTICHKNNVTLIAYLEPQLSIIKHYNKSEYDIYQTKLGTYLASQKVPVFDYTYILPATPEYFVDNIHLKPKGYETLARKFWSDYELYTKTGGLQ